jgi:hypothetical protein
VALKSLLWLPSDAAYRPRSVSWTRLKGAIRGTIAVVHELLQVQAEPQLQVSPHAQAAFEGSAFGVWHPHWQAAPGQGLQEHWVELDMVCFPLDFVDLLPTK